MGRAGAARVLVIGLDSFDPALAQAWMAEGKLPNLARQMAASVTGRVRNPHSFESASVWPSFCFGADPGIHGVFDGARDLATVRERRGAMPDVRPIWSILETAGKRTIVIEVPIVPEGGETKGIRVVNWFSHQPPEGRYRLALTTHPPELREVIERNYGGDPLHGRTCDYHLPRTAAQLGWFRDALLERVQTKTALALDLMRAEEWDFFLVNFEDSHCAGHHCWHLQEGAGDDFDAGLAALVGNPLQAVYMAIDEAVGALVAQAGDADVLVFMSHGLEPAHTGLRLLDRILARLNGEVDETRDTALTRTRRIWRTLPTRVRHMLRPLLGAVRDSLYGNGLLPAPEKRRCHEVYCSERCSGIRVSLAGRDPGGMVRPEDYEAYCDWLIMEIGAVRNDATGEPLVREIIRTRDHYNGPMAATMPDLTVSWNRRAPIPSVSSPAIGRIRHPHPSIRTGDHSLDGFFLLAGPGFAPRRLNDGVSVIDLAPSLAALLGVDTSPFQGRALDQLAPAIQQKQP